MSDLHVVYEHGNRVTDGGCTWENTPAADAALNDLLKKDAFAYGEITGQIRESENRGLGRSKYRTPQDYRCPLPIAPRGVVDPPWMGELKAASKSSVRRSRSREWRLYFGEPINKDHLVVAVDLRDSKLGRLDARSNSNRQKKHIREAMTALKVHFTELGYVWAPFR